MFAQIKVVVDLIRGAMSSLKAFKADEDRKAFALEMLRIYFALKDCVDEGSTLLAAAGCDPLRSLQSMSGSELENARTTWNAILQRQGLRLYTLAGRIRSLDVLSVVDPNLQAKLEDAIGSKFDDVVTLQTIGAALYLRLMFRRSETVEELANYVAMTSGSDTDTFDMPRVRTEIEALQNSLHEYRGLIERFLSDQELVTFSRRARNDTRLNPTE